MFDQLECAWQTKAKMNMCRSQFSLTVVDGCTCLLLEVRMGQRYLVVLKDMTPTLMPGCWWPLYQRH
ncbi:hypothetical protein AM593_10232, partial [Mytilus galloprovincialis]